MILLAFPFGTVVSLVKVQATTVAQLFGRKLRCKLTDWCYMVPAVAWGGTDEAPCFFSGICPHARRRFSLQLLSYSTSNNQCHTSERWNIVLNYWQWVHRQRPRSLLRTVRSTELYARASRERDAREHRTGVLQRPGGPGRVRIWKSGLHLDAQPTLAAVQPRHSTEYCRQRGGV